MRSKPKKTHVVNKSYAHIASFPQFRQQKVLRSPRNDQTDHKLIFERNQDLLKKKAMPDPYEIPAVEDYVVGKPTIPKEEE